MPFTNPIIAGNEDLIRSGIKSPNFVHEKSGWRVGRDGSAEFQYTEITTELDVNSLFANFINIGASMAPNSPMGPLGYARFNNRDIATVDQIPAIPTPQIIPLATYTDRWNTFGYGFQAPRAVLLNGIVILEGTLTMPSPNAQTVGSPIMQLIPSLRPTSRRAFTVWGSGTNGPFATRVDIETTGNVSLQFGTIPTNGYLLLDGITYSTA